MSNNRIPIEQLLRLVSPYETNFRDFARSRPAVKKTYDDMVNDIQAGKLVGYAIPENEWDAFIQPRFKNNNHVGGFYVPGDTNKLYIPNNKLGYTQSLPHELGHYFAGHRAQEDMPNNYKAYGTPEAINPYIKLDMKLNGWLPSFHPAGRRPTMPGDNALSKAWNKHIATQDVEYSNKNNYHPWYDEHAFDSLANKKRLGPALRQAVKNSIDTAQEAYNKYRNPSFKSAFRRARKKGKNTFTWKGNEYTTELK